MGPGPRRRLPDCLGEMGEGRRRRHLAEEPQTITGRGNRLAQEEGHRIHKERTLNTHSGYHFCDTHSGFSEHTYTLHTPHRTANCCSLEPCYWALIPHPFPLFSFQFIIYAFVGGVCTTHPYEIVIECWIPRMSVGRSLLASQVAGQGVWLL